MGPATGHRTGVAQSGRPRDPLINTAVLTATLAALHTSGYGRLSLEDVARRAGTSRPAIYRRWPTRQHLVLEALARNLSKVVTPDTGCTLCDLCDAIKLFLMAFAEMPPDVLAPLAADCATDAELNRAFRTTIFDPPREAVARTVDEALARGDLRTETDRELTVDFLASLVHYRALFGHAPTSDAQVERAVTTLLQGIATDYSRLLRISRRKSGNPNIHHRHAGDATASPSSTGMRRRGAARTRG